MSSATRAYASVHYARFISLQLSLREAIRNKRWERASNLADQILALVHHK